MRTTMAWVAVAGIALALTGCREVHGEARVAPRPVKVMEVRPIDAPARIRYAVNIQPRESVTLAFKASGYVDQIIQRRGADGRVRALQAGDVVPAGAILARVREADYRERLNQADASLRELEATLAKARLDRDRARSLFAAQALVKPDLDAAEAAFDANSARIAAARAQIETAAIALRDTALIAPIGGVVLERRVEVGNLVGSGSVGFVLGDISSAKAVFGVPDALVGRIAMGQPLVVTTEAFSGARFQGRVTAVAPSADPQTRVFDIEVSIVNADGRLRPGMIGAIELAADSTPRPDAALPAVPLSAIVRTDANNDRYAVYVADAVGAETTVHARTIALGSVAGNLVAVTAGLRAGERVVVMGATLVKDGETVRVIP